MNAEQIREARRQKLLANAEKRMQLITGQNTPSSKPDITSPLEKPNIETDSFIAHLPATSGTFDTTVTRSEIRQRSVNPLWKDESNDIGANERVQINRFMNFDGTNQLNNLLNDSVPHPTTSKPIVESTDELKSISVLRHRLALVITAVIAFVVLMSNSAAVILNSAWVPFILVEVYLQWRMPFTEPKGSLLFAALMMSGLPQSTMSQLKKLLSIAQSCGVDLAFYLFTFVTLYALTTVFQ